MRFKAVLNVAFLTVSLNCRLIGRDHRQKNLSGIYLSNNRKANSDSGKRRKSNAEYVEKLVKSLRVFSFLWTSKYLHMKRKGQAIALSILWESAFFFFFWIGPIHFNTLWNKIIRIDACYKNQFIYYFLEGNFVTCFLFLSLVCWIRSNLQP